MNKLSKRLWTALLFFGRAKVFFYLLIWLMALLVIGTIAQKYIGLYQSQKLFFSSFVIWIGGFLPVPGGYTTLTFIFISLFSKLVTERWTKAKTGTLVIHCGALLLLIGGFLTATFSTEGGMVIREGTSSAVIEDYHHRELVITEQDGASYIFTHEQLKSGTRLGAASLPFMLTIDRYFENFTLAQRENFISDGSTHGMLVANDMRAAPRAPADEKNLTGLTFRLAGANKSIDGLYGIFENMPITQNLRIGKKSYRVELRRQRTILPFEIKLIKFQKDVYPGTDKAREYQSEVLLKDGDLQWHSLISMNSPLRYKGYTFFQASFVEDNRGSATVLAAVNNIGATFPYISSIIICIGLLIHLIVRIPKLKAKPTLLLLLLLLVPSNLRAENAERLNLSAFQQIPVLHDGRVKPLASFARTYLLAFSGKSALPQTTASEWLAETILAPKQAYARAIFNIPSPDVVNALGLAWREEHFYSFDELSKAFDQYESTIRTIERLDDAQRTPSQQQLLEIYSKAAAFALISQSLSSVLPHFKIDDTDLARKFHTKSGEATTYIDLMPYEKDIRNIVNILSERTINTLTPKEKERVLLALNYGQISRHQQSKIFKIIPPQWQSEGEEWAAPWAVVMDGKGSPQTAEMMGLWKQLAVAYAHHDTGAWQRTSIELRDKTFSFAGTHASASKQKLEVFYLQANFFTIALIIYLISFIALVTFFLYSIPIFYKAAFIMIPLGAALQLIGIIIRIIIMNRPPVATLYETTIFVSLIAVILALAFEWKKRDATGLVAGSVVGTVLLFISTRYAIDGDTMEMLVAVLNTNFWLATHVVTITMGYGCALISGTLAHTYLIHRLLRPKAVAAQQNILNTVLATALIAAFFAILGTILGGIWADQSWGRFWGWDPKENGAMFIVLWLLWLLHGKVANVLSPLNFISVALLTNVVVALSWFGVNLLNVGLHSYGFTNNIAAGLGSFCSAEILFLIATRLALRAKA